MTQVVCKGRRKSNGKFITTVCIYRLYGTQKKATTFERKQNKAGIMESDHDKHINETTPGKSRCIPQGSGRARSLGGTGPEEPAQINFALWSCCSSTPVGLNSKNKSVSVARRAIAKPTKTTCVNRKRKHRVRSLAPPGVCSRDGRSPLCDTQPSLPVHA